MAAEDRIETRHEPLKIPVSTPKGDLVISLWPLPWRKKNDLGALVTASSARAITAIRDIIEQAQANAEENPLGEAREYGETDYLSQMDFLGIFEFAFSQYDYDDEKDDGSFVVTPPSAEARKAFNLAGEQQMLDILGEALKLNGLERLVWLLDGNPKDDLTTGESAVPNEAVEETTGAGEKMESPIDSGSASQAGQEAN